MLKLLFQITRWRSQMIKLNAL